MKLSFVLACTCLIFSIKKAVGSAIGAPFYPLNPEDLSDGDIKELEYWDKYYHRSKRTLEPAALGSAKFIVQLKTAAISGIKVKIVEIARASIGASIGTVAGASTGAKNTAGLVAKGLGGAILGSAGGVNHLKSAILTEIQKKIGQAIKASAGAAAGGIGAASAGAGLAGKSVLGAITSGSAKGVHQLKSAALNQIGVIASGSAKHIAGASTGVVGGSANAIKHLKSAAGAHLVKIATGASSSLGLASTGAVSGSATALHSLKNALVSGITKKVGHIASGSAGALTGLATAGSAGAGHIAKGVTGALTGSANAINQLKLAVAGEIKNKIGQIAGGSAKLATGASTGFHSKVKQVSGDIVVGGVDVANQLKTAIAAGTEKKLAQAASGFAGAITGAVGSASAGLGQITRGVVAGSTNVFNEVKAGILLETQRKIGQVLKASSSASGQIGQGAGFALQGSHSALTQLKSAIISSIKNQIGQLATGSATAVTSASGHASKGVTFGLAGSASAIHQLKNAIFSLISKNIGYLAFGSAKAISGASGHASKGTGAVISGSANAINQLKSAAVSHITNKIGEVARGSLSASAGASALASKGTHSAISGSAGAINQLKSAAVSHLTAKIGQIGKASASAVVGASVGASGKISKATGSVVTGSASAIHGLKSAVVSNVKSKLGQVASGAVSASKNIVGGVSSSVTQLKAGFHQQVSNLAEASAEIRRKRSVDGFFPAGFNLDGAGTDLPKRSESAWSTGSGSGSGDILNHLKSAVVSGLKQKIGQLAKGSAGAVAGASAGFSKGSFGGDSKGYYPHAYEPSPHDTDEHKNINVWDLKKSVFNTLLQAVKAIKGGVLAIKGQLIKGSGFAVAGGGKLIAASGDKVTKLGKNIISNAVLVHPNKEHYTHSDHGSPSSSYTAPSGPPVIYAAPSPSSAPGNGYESHYESHYDHHNVKPHGSQAGILILRRIPSATHDKYHSSHSHVEESVVPAFKPLSPTGPTFGTVVGKFFTASTSLNPSEPSPFTNSDIHPIHSYDGISHYGADQGHISFSAPSPTHFEEPRHHQQAAAVSYQAPLIKEHKIASNVDYSIGFGGNLQPPSPPATNYGVPFEESFGFQNTNNLLGAEASVVNEQKVKLTKGEILDKLEGSPTLATSEVQVSKDAPESVQALKSSVSHNNDHTLGPPFNSDYLPNNNFHRSKNPIKSSSAESLSSQPASLNYIRSALYAEKDNVVPLDASSVDTSQEYKLSKKTNSREAFSQKLEQSNLLANFLPKEDPSSFSGSYEASSDELSSKESYMKFLEKFPFHKVHPTTTSRSYKTYSISKPVSSQKLRTLRSQSSHRQRKPSSRPDFSVVKSLSYEITPHGAKRLT